MLQGSLDVFSLTDVLRLVSQAGTSGFLSIRRPGAAGSIGLSGGSVVGGELAGIAAADPDGLFDAALTLVDSTGGDFQFVEGEPFEVGRFSVDEFLAAVDEHRARWQAIVGELGGLDQPVGLNPNLPDEDSTVTLSAHEWKLAVLADGRRTVNDLAAEAGLSVLRTAQTLVEMQRSGLLDGIATSPPPAPAPVARTSKKAAKPPREPVPVAEVADEEPAAEDEDGVDPGTLLRELGADEQGGRRPPTREEQRLRLRRW